MKLRTKTSIFQNVVCVIYHCCDIVVINLVAAYIRKQELIKQGEWPEVICIWAFWLICTLCVSIALQDAFGLPWFTDSSIICATSIRKLSRYQPSSVKIHSPYLSLTRHIKLYLTVDMDDLSYLDDDRRRDRRQYFIFLKGYFPFTEDGMTRLYFTRAAIRKINRLMKREAKKERSHSDDDSLCYVQLEFDFTMPYFGRDVPWDERYYLLSRWDLQELKHCLENDCYECDAEAGELTLTRDDLAEYRDCLEDMDTFIRIDGH